MVVVPSWVSSCAAAAANAAVTRASSCSLALRCSSNDAASAMASCLSSSSSSSLSSLEANASASAADDSIAERSPSSPSTSKRCVACCHCSRRLGCHSLSTSAPSSHVAHPCEGGSRRSEGAAVAEPRGGSTRAAESARSRASRAARRPRPRATAAPRPRDEVDQTSCAAVPPQLPGFLVSLSFLRRVLNSALDMGSSTSGGAFPWRTALCVRRQWS